MQPFQGWFFCGERTQGSAAGPGSGATLGFIMKPLWGFQIVIALPSALPWVASIPLKTAKNQMILAKLLVHRNL